MKLGGIAETLQLASFVIKALQDPEGTAIKLIDDFKRNDKSSEVVDRVVARVCDRYDCYSIGLRIGDGSVVIEFGEADDLTDKILGDINSLLAKIEPYVPKDVSIGDFLEEITVWYSNTNMITSVEIPINSEKIMAKLKEALEE